MPHLNEPEFLAPRTQGLPICLPVMEEMILVVSQQLSIGLLLVLDTPLLTPGNEKAQQLPRFHNLGGVVPLGGVSQIVP